MNKSTSSRLKKRIGADSAPAYRNSKLSVGSRVRDLLQRMTLEEKAAQMMCIWQQKADTLIDERGHFDRRKALRAFRDGHGIGQVGRPSDAGSTPSEPWKGRDARQQADLTNADPAVLYREHATRYPRHIPRGMSSRPSCGWRHQFPATDRVSPPPSIPNSSNRSTQ